MMSLLVLCALYIAQNCAEAEDYDSEPLRPFPLVDIREFYNTTGYIWSYVSTQSDILCKVDHPEYELYKEVLFTRSYRQLSDRKINKNVTVYLKGTFVDMEFRYQPTMMQVTSANKDEAHTEQMVYEDAKHTCGVFLTSSQLPLANTYTYNRYYNYTICEVRYRGNKKGPKRTDTCESYFIGICNPKKIYSLYENCTRAKEKIPETSKRNTISLPPVEYLDDSGWSAAKL